jgi:hypothetical protein
MAAPSGSGSYGKGGKFTPPGSKKQTARKASAAPKKFSPPGNKK